MSIRIDVTNWAAAGTIRELAADADCGEDVSPPGAMRILGDAERFGESLTKEEAVEAARIVRGWMEDPNWIDTWR